MLDKFLHFLYNKRVVTKIGRKMLEQLIETYKTWIAEQNLPLMSADELAWEDCVNAEQREWLLSFCEEWENAE